MVAIRTAAFPGPRHVPAELIKPAVRTRGQQLLAEIEAFMRANPKVTRNMLGKKAINNPGIVQRLEGGLEPQDITCRRIRHYMETYQAREGGRP